MRGRLLVVAMVVVALLSISSLVFPAITAFLSGSSAFGIRVRAAAGDYDVLRFAVEEVALCGGNEKVAAALLHETCAARAGGSGVHLVWLMVSEGGCVDSVLVVASVDVMRGGEVVATSGGAIPITAVLPRPVDARRGAVHSIVLTVAVDVSDAKITPGDVTAEASVS